MAWWTLNIGDSIICIDAGNSAVEYDKPGVNWLKEGQVYKVRAYEPPRDGMCGAVQVEGSVVVWGSVRFEKEEISHAAKKRKEA